MLLLLFIPPLKTQAEISRSLGAKVLAVRVGESSIRDLQKVADPPAKEHIFKGDTFNDLQDIITQVGNFQLW